MKLKWILLVLAGSAALYFIFDLLLITEEEEVEAVISAGKEAAERGDAAAVDALISEHYDCERLDREAFLEKAKAVLQTYSPMEIMLLGEKVDFPSEGSAKVRLLAVIMPKGSSQLPGTTRSAWEVSLQKEEGKWKVVGIRIAP